MTKKQLQKTFRVYAKTGDLLPLAKTFKRLLLKLTKNDRGDIDIDLVLLFPFIYESLKSISLRRKRIPKKKMI